MAPRQDQRIVIADLRGGRNDTDPPMSLRADQAVEMLNVDQKDTPFARKRGGAVTVSLSGGTAFDDVIATLIRHVPGASEAAAELWAFDADRDLNKRLTGGTSWADVTFSDAIAADAYGVVGATLDGKLYLGYDSTEDRLHVYDPTLSSPRVRRVGIRTGNVAPTAADSGSGAYAATARYYRVRWIETNYSIAQSQTTTDANDSLRQASANTRLAQGFQLSTAGAVIAAEMTFGKTGTAIGSVWVTIEADSGGDPDGTPLQTSDSLAVPDITDSATAYTRFTFPAPVQLSASTQYHLVMHGSYAIDGSNYVVWRGNSAGAYASGSSKDYSGAAWSAATNSTDFMFRLYVTSDSLNRPRLIRRSEPTPSQPFTPSGSGTHAVVTQPTVPSEQETHWEVEASADDITFYTLYSYNATGYLGDAVPIATTTANDTATAAQRVSGALSDPIGFYVLPPSARYLLSDGNRLLMAGDPESGTPQSRIWFTPVLGSADRGDSERVPSQPTQKNWVDLNENDGGALTGLGGPLNGVVYAFKYRQVHRLRPTGDVAAPFLPRKIRDDIGCIQHKTIAIGEDEIGRSALYFLSHRGPYRITFEGDVQYLGRDNEVTWRSVNLAATTVVAHSVYYPDLHQWWIWIATGSANVPDVKMVFDVYKGFPDENGIVRGGWFKHTGNSAAAACSCLMSNTLGATMSRDLKPYIGRASGTAIWKCDTSDLDDGGTDFQAYVKSRPVLTSGELGRKVGLEEPYLLAKTLSGVTLTLTTDRDFGAETRTHTVLLTAAASETRALKKVEGAGVGEADVIQVQIGDGSAQEGAWSLDALVIPKTTQEAR